MIACLAHSVLIGVSIGLAAVAVLTLVGFIFRSNRQWRKADEALSEFLRTGRRS